MGTTLGSTQAVTVISSENAARLGVAGMLALLRLSRELAYPERGIGASLVFFVWAASTAGIAGRLWIDLLQELY